MAQGYSVKFYLFFKKLNYFSKKAVEDVAQTGRICLLDVDKQGVKNIRNTELHPLFIYISPPSYEILEKRLRGRQTDTEAAIEKRLKEAKESMEFSKEPGMYDYIILNDKLEEAYQQLREILRKVNIFY
jgi:guanylate kinase